MFACSITFLCTALIAAFAGFVVIQHPEGAAIAQQVFLASLLLFAGFALAEVFRTGIRAGVDSEVGPMEPGPAPVPVTVALAQPKTDQ